MKITSGIRIATLTLLLATLSAQADDAGSVLFSKGNVTAQRDTVVTLAKGDGVLASDAINTGDASRAQLLMIDGAKIAIRPNSEIRIDEYSYAAVTTTVVEQSDDSSVISLVKGGGAVPRDARSVDRMSCTWRQSSPVFCHTQASVENWT